MLSNVLGDYEIVNSDRLIGECFTLWLCLLREFNESVNDVDFYGLEIVVSRNQPGQADFGPLFTKVFVVLLAYAEGVAVYRKPLA